VKPIFIVGPHRTGSTLWHNIIAMSPGILRLAEPRFLSRPGQRDFLFFVKTQIGTLADDGNVERMVQLCVSGEKRPGLEGVFWRFHHLDAAAKAGLGRAMTESIKQSDRSLGAIARIIIEETTRFSGCSRACVKFPVDVGHLGELLEWFPDCKVVHITRDPRAVALSKSNDPYGTALRVLKHPRLASFIRRAMMGLVVAQYWWTARIHSKFQACSNYRLFRYEDLLADPERTLRELCEFIEVDFIETMLTPERGEHEHQASSLSGRQQKAFDPESATRWRSTMSTFDGRMILLLTRRSMKTLGYSGETHPVFKLDQTQRGTNLK
jgi:hypothetical protein